MARLPIVDGDTNDWGTILNDFLSVEHDADGTHKRANHMPLFGNVYSPAGDGVTDGTAKLQQAVNENRQLFIPAGTYKVTEAITVPSDTIIMGTSGSILLQTNLPEDPRGAGTYGLFTLIAGTENVEISGLTFKGEHTGPFATLSDIFTNGHATTVLVEGVTCDNIRVHHNQFLNLQGSSVHVPNGGNLISFTDNYMYQCGDGININSDTSITANNIVVECEGIENIAHFGIISNNIFWRNHGGHVINAGGFIATNPPEPPLKLGTIVTNNVVADHVNNGILVQQSTASIIVANNTVTHGGGNGVTLVTLEATPGLVIQNVTIQNNLIVGCTNGESIGIGMRIPFDASITGTRILNNRVLNGTNSTYFNTVGMTISQPDAIVRGNIFEGTAEDVTIHSLGTNLQMVDNIHSTGAKFDFRAGASFAPLWNRLTNEDGTQSIAAVVPVSKTATFTADTATDTYICDATSAAISANLPTAVGISGSKYTVKKTDSSGNGVTLDPNGSETIDGAATKQLQSQHATMTIVSDGANWMITKQLGTVA